MRDRSAAIRGLLAQGAGAPALLADQIVGLFALQRGYLGGLTAEEAEAKVRAAVDKANAEMPVWATGRD